MFSPLTQLSAWPSCPLENVSQSKSFKSIINDFVFDVQKYAVLFTDLPKIKKPPPSNFTTKEGNNVSLPCYPTGFPTPVVMWYKNGEALDGNQYNAATGLLTFSSILFADRGSYKCEARNFLGFDYATVEITVEGKWKIRGH